MKKRFFWLGILLSVVVFMFNCIGFDIQNDIDYPKDRFISVGEKISQIDPDKTPELLKLMVYDGSDRQLITFSLDLDLVLKFSDNHQVDEDCAGFEKYSKGFLDSLSIEDLRKLQHASQGLVIEVRDVEENSHVLIWLE